MAITLPQGFKITGKDPVDSRLVLTKAEMLAVKKAQIPNQYFCICKDDNRLYIYNSTNTLDPEIGYFRPSIYDEIDKKILRGYYLNNTFWTDSTYTTEMEKLTDSIYIDANTDVVYTYNGTAYKSVNDTLPLGSDVIAGILKLYQTHGQNIDGTMSQKVITDGVNSIKFALDEEEAECLVLDLPWD